MPNAETVVFIAGASHSGSTLLGLCLGAHPAIFYAGEARKSLFLSDPAQPLSKRICKTCGPACRIWGGVSTEPGRALYDQLAERSGRSIVVDSTKAAAWIDEQHALARARGARSILIHLTRDARALVASGKRKHPELALDAHIEKWRAQILATEELTSRFDGPIERVDYEAFVAAPERTLRRLAGALGLPFDPAMLDPFSAEQHPIGGNAGTQSLLEHTQTSPGGLLAISGAKEAYYAEHPKAFVLDRRWERELSPDEIARIDREARELDPRRGASPKIFCVGLSRTGTRSLTSALGMLGFSIDHYPIDRATLETLARGDVRFPQLARVDGLSDITIAPLYEDLDRAYPGSRFILTIRDEEPWLDSCARHWADRPAFQALPREGKGRSAEEHATHMEIRRFLRAAVYASYDFHRERFRRAYRRHVAGVLAYFADRPGDLLVIDVTAGEGFEKLAPFLDRPVPSEPFPHRGAHLDPARAQEKRARDDARGDFTSRLDENE